jgi:tetratricopeptide (TPR) repeat protein
MAVADSDVVEALVEDAHPAATLHLADLEHPWLGLESFREETRAYFFGRDTETAELHLRLRSHPLLVLYGRSGLGKTSILMAGLIPRLRAEEQRPLLLRLRYEDPALDVCGQLVSAVFGWGDRQGAAVGLKPRPTKSLLWTERLAEKLKLPLPDDLPSRLWLRLHYRAEPPDITHLILDQFEEVFTLGALRAGTEHEVRDVLAIILQGAIPEPISRLIAEHDVFLDHFDPDSIPVRVILALRNDYVYALNRWKRHLLVLGQNNFELRALRGPAAFDAVFKPGELRCKYRGAISEQNKVDTGLPPIVSKETAERIVRFVARKDEDVPLEEIEAVPPILSLLCRELNERRFSEPGGTPEMPARQITFSQSDADVETIIKTFYERCLAGQPEGVRVFIEEGLVSYSGARLAQDEKSILRCFEEGWDIPGALDGRRAAGFGDAAKARECLKDLVNQRLLTSLGGGDNPSYELIHDLLAAVAEKSRTAREERVEKEEAGRRADAEKAAKENAEKQARRAQRTAITVSAALVVAVVAAVAGFVQNGKARAAKNRAEKLIAFMTFDLRDKLQPIGRLNLLDDVNRSVQAYYDSFAGEDKSPEFLRQRSVMFHNQGDVLLAQGDLAGALKSYRDSLAIFEKLSKQDPGNAGWQRDLSVSYDSVGDVQSAQGDLASALKSYRDSLAICEKLSKQDPGNAGWQRDLSLSYDRVGDVQRAQGDLTGALKSYRDSLAICEKLSKQDPGNAGWQYILAVVYEEIGNVQRDQKSFSAALKSYHDGQATMEKLVKHDPSNADWKRRFSATYEDIGKVLRDQGDLVGALKNFNDGLAITKELLQQNSSNLGWQSDLSEWYADIGKVLRDQGDLVGALKNYRDSLGIREELAIRDPSNAGWQGDLGWIYWQTGAVLEKVQPGSKEEGVAMVQKGHDILGQLKERTGLTVEQQKWLGESETDLARMREANR